MAPKRLRAVGSVRRDQSELEQCRPSEVGTSDSKLALVAEDAWSCRGDEYRRQETDQKHGSPGGSRSL